MELYRSPLTRIDHQEIRRYAGDKGHQELPAQLIAQAELDALCQAQPQGVWCTYPYCAGQGLIQANHFTTVSGTSIRCHLSPAHCVSVLTVTIGETVETTIHTLFQQGEYTAAILLDAAATAATEQVADSITRLIRQQANRQGCSITSRFSPGYGNWGLEIQPAMLQLSGAHKIGVRATESYMLIPRKSVTAVIGWTSQTPPPQTTQSPCAQCTQKNCIARKEQLK